MARGPLMRMAFIIGAAGALVITLCSYAGASAAIASNGADREASGACLTWN